MALSTPLFVNEFGTQQFGYDTEEKRRYDSRLQKRKDLQELADQADRELGVDEWFRMAQESIGAGGLLYGDSPTKAMLESIRASSNKKAAEADAKRKYEQATRNFDLDEKLRTRAMELARTGKSELDIHEDIRNTWGDEVAGRMRPRLGSYVSSAALEDEKSGRMFGEALMSMDDAEEWVKSHPTVSEAVKNGVRTQARLNEDKAEEAVAAISARLGSSGGFINSPEQRAMVRSQLPPALQRSPRVEEYVDKVMKAAPGAAQVQQGADRRAISNSAGNAWAVAGPQVAGMQANVDFRDQQQLQANIQAAEQATLNAAKTRSSLAAAQISTIIGKKPSANVQARAGRASAILSEYDVPASMQDELLRAITQGDEAVSAIEAKIRRSSPSLQQMTDATRKVEMAKMGHGFTGNPATDYMRVASIGTDPTMLYNIGVGYAQEMKAGKTAAANGTIKNVLTNIARGIEMTRDTLASAGSVGKFGASAEDMNYLEQQSLVQQLQPLAMSTGIPMEQLVAGVRSQLKPPTGIMRTPTIADRYNQNTTGAWGTHGQPAMAGGYSGYGAMPPAANPGYGRPVAAPMPTAPMPTAPMPTAPVPSGPIPPTPPGAAGPHPTNAAERAMVGQVAFTPLEQANSDAIEANPANLAAIDAEIARTRSPEIRAILMRERENVVRRISGAGAQPQPAAYQAPGLPPVRMPWESLMPDVPALDPAGFAAQESAAMGTTAQALEAKAMQEISDLQRGVRFTLSPDVQEFLAKQDAERRAASAQQQNAWLEAERQRQLQRSRGLLQGR